ncbi:TIM44-like domain-containing protein [Nitrospirillum iridis]|uniref:Putative lipid-binding transport protein (Tim44 family) n=1 Tax=Nitrospirillum iridis TaxID=765888 RepID=A0A7X0AUB5_9PROT|nr:TIM44-like domain-containing protein [Nitrospirillum iridis]MBB6250188.1 putative lipid-binding transport protein (Tim44 family) [Nitrospirillum iridis]
MFGRFGSRAVAAVLAVALALAPLAADARPGRSSSSGSRGSRTYTTPATPSVTGQPIQRSITPPPAAAPAAPAYQPRPGFQQPFAQPGFAQPSFTQRHPFLSGMMGGFLGASLYNSFFGHHGYGAGGDYGSGSGGAFGGFLRILIMLGIAWMIWRLVRMALGGPRPATNSGMTYELYQPQEPPYQATPFGSSYGQGGAMPPPAPVPAIGVQMQGQDLSAFEQILTGIMDGWSRGDLTALRRHLTPEMLSYYGEEMTENQSRGIRNQVADVQLVKGDVVESWQEEGRTYCTALLRWRARDWTVNEATGRVVEGDEHRPEEVQELWTFVRADGGHWLLSAIQQV